MSRPKLPRNATLTDLTGHMLTQPMPASDDPRDCLMELGVRPTCAAYIVFGMIQKAAKGDTSAAKFITVHKSVNAISDCHTGSIENQIIDIGYTSGKEQLNQLDNKRQPRTGKKHFPESIQALVQNWHNDACRYKHANISDDINCSFAFYVIIQNVYKRNQVDSKRLNAVPVDDKRLNLTVDSEKGVKDKTNQNSKIDIHQKKKTLSFPGNLLLLYPYHSSAEKPQQGKKQFTG